MDTSNLLRISASLACQRLNGTHSYDQLPEAIQFINAELNLDSNKIIVSIIDYGSNFIKAFKKFSVHLTNTETNEVLNDSFKDKENQEDLDSVELNFRKYFSDGEDENSYATQMLLILTM